MELYHNGMSVCAQKVRLVLAEKDLQPVEHLINLRAGGSHTPAYLRLNPNGVVPTLVDYGRPIVESTVICEYLDDAYPHSPLKPESPNERAEMRRWTLLPDAALHRACGYISAGIARRHQILAAGGAQMRDMGRQLSRLPYVDVVQNGLDSPHMPPRFRCMTTPLAGRPTGWRKRTGLRAIGTVSLTQSMMPYILRLQHLEMDWIWDETRKNAIERWIGRSQARTNYRGISDYLDENYLALAREKGRESALRLKALLREVRS